MLEHLIGITLTATNGYNSDFMMEKRKWNVKNVVKFKEHFTILAIQALAMKKNLTVRFCSISVTQKDQNSAGNHKFNYI